MSNTNQNPYPIDPEHEQPIDESGLVGESDSPDNTGLVGSPGPLDDSGLEGSGEIDVAGTTGYGTDTVRPDQTGLAGTSGTGTTDYAGRDSTELPDQQLLQPDYNPQVGDAGRLQDLERGGSNPTGYDAAPGQSGTADQPMYANRDDENAPAGPDADMRPNDPDQQTGY